MHGSKKNKKLFQRHTKINFSCILIIRINYSVRYFLQNNNSK
jgi:hypothetical protein